jgi:hypothetical protein
MTVSVLDLRDQANYRKFGLVILSNVYEMIMRRRKRGDAPSLSHLQYLLSPPQQLAWANEICMSAHILDVK